MKLIKLIFIFSLIYFIFSNQMISAVGNKPNNPEACKLFLESKKADSINFVILGDGFTANDINSGFYERKVAELMDKFFFVAPYAQFKEYFNIYVVYAMSRDRGADDFPGKDIKDTVFNATYGTYGIQRLLTVQNTTAVEKYVSYATDNPHNIIILVNDERYGGAGGSYTIASINSSAFSLILHEMGHSFGCLADEYIDESIASKYPVEDAKSAGNVDLTNNKSTIKWAHFIGLNGYDIVGIFEGGYYRSKGVYRSQNSCMMKSLGSPYCHVCRELITKNVIKILNKNYDFNEFLIHDPIEKNGELLVYSPMNSLGKGIGQYEFSDDGSYKVNNSKVLDSREKKVDYIVTNEIYMYYNGYFIYKKDKQWEEKNKSKDIFYFTETSRDDNYIYLFDSRRNVNIAVPINHQDLYIWDGKQWQILYQVNKINYIPEY